MILRYNLSKLHSELTEKLWEIANSLSDEQCQHAIGVNFTLDSLNRKPLLSHLDITYTIQVGSGKGISTLNNEHYRDLTESLRQSIDLVRKEMNRHGYKKYVIDLTASDGINFNGRVRGRSRSVKYKYKL